MPWFNVDDQFHSHPKARRAGLEALGLWAVAGSYCMGYKTDGFVAEWFVMAWKNGKRHAAALVAAGLWSPTEQDGETGWAFHDWSHFQKTAEDIEKDRAAARERQRQRRERQRNDGEGSPSVTRDTQRDSRSSSAEPPGSTPHHTKHPSDVASEPRPDVERICLRLADLIENNGSKRPTITKGWRDAARLMLDNDKRNDDEIHWLIDWCQADEFWRTNIMSMPKFREKYDQLRLKANQTNVRRFPTAEPQPAYETPEAPAPESVPW